MAQLNFHINEDTKQKLDWLSSATDDTYSGTIRKLIIDAFEKETRVYKEDKQFLEWLNRQRQ